MWQNIIQRHQLRQNSWREKIMSGYEAGPTIVLFLMIGAIVTGIIMIAYQIYDWFKERKTKVTSCIGSGENK
jgi:hypothetical protein